MKYHIFKMSRLYNGSPYKGTTWLNARAPAETNDINLARKMARLMAIRNPVGWDIYNSLTREIVK